MDVPVTENHKATGANEHVSLKETVTNKVDALPSTMTSLEIGQGDNATVNPPSESSVQVESNNKLDIQPSETVKVLEDVKEHVNNEPSKLVPNIKTVSNDNTEKPEYSVNDVGTPLASEVSTSTIEPAAVVPTGALSDTGTIAPLEVSVEKSGENNYTSATSPLSDVSSGDMDEDFEDSVDLSDKCKRDDVTIVVKQRNKLEIPSVAGLLETVNEKSCDKELPIAKSPIPSEKQNVNVVNNPADNERVTSGNGVTVEAACEDSDEVAREIPSDDVSKVATDQIEDDVLEPLAETETTQNRSSPSTELEKECMPSPVTSPKEVEESVPSPGLLPTSAVEETSKNTPSTEAAHKITPSLSTSTTASEEIEPSESIVSTAMEEGGLLNQSTQSSEAVVKTTPEHITPTIELVEVEKSMDATEQPTDTTKEVGDDAPISQNIPKDDDSLPKQDNTEDLKATTPSEVPPGDSASNDESKTSVSEVRDLKSQGERPKSTLPEEETSLNLSEAGDEDQEMQEFEHVSSKLPDTDGDKDLGEPMSVDVVDESVEESMEVNTIDVDPIGLANEPETKLDESEEPMDVDDASDKDKSQDVSDSNEKALADTTEQKENEPTEKDSSTDTAATSSTDKADESLEIITGDKSSTEQVDASAATALADQPQDESKEADEEICIIPDTFRVIGSQDLIDKNQSTGKDKPDKDDDNDETESGKKDGKTKSDKGKEDKGKHGVGRPPGRRSDKSSPTIVEVEVKKKEYSGRPQRLAAKKAVSQIKELAKEDSNSGDGLGKFQTDDIKEVESTAQMCYQCCRVTACKYQVYIAGRQRYLCQEPCYNLFRSERDKSSESPVAGGSDQQISNTARDFVRKCGQCEATIVGEEKTLAWETMDFCNEECLGKYQTQLGSFCANCKGPTAPASLGKYCVRFGYDIRQFCCSSCLEEFKKGLKVCSYCQKDISSGAEGFLAPVGDKGQFKDFCRQKCMEKYDNMSNNVTPPVVMHKCAVCDHEKVVKFQFILNSKVHKLCSEPCFAAFKFVNNVKDDECDMCKKFFDKVHTEVFTVYYDETPHSFCCKTCMNVYILANRKIVPCNWCKVKKYNFDMIRRVVGSGQQVMMCSLNCLTLYQVSVSAVSSKRITCDMCSGVAQAQYHLTMSDATIRNFCSYQCVMSFQGQFGKAPPLSIAGGDKTPTPTPAAPAIPATPPIPAGGAKRVYSTRRSVNQAAQSDSLSSNNNSNSLGPVISSVTSLAPSGQASSPTTRSQALKLPPQVNNVSVPVKPQVLYKQQLLVKPPAPKDMRNKFVSCKPITVNKGVSCRPHACNKETQTDDNMGKPVLIPIPVPIYVPAPMHMYCSPFPVPVPFPLPIPVPMFIPTTRHSAQGILREIKRIQEKIPTDPFEAELLMMAEMVADDKKPAAESDSESDAADNDAGDPGEPQGASSAAEGGFSPEAVDTSNFGEDMLQMALKMASELEEPAVDLEAALTPSTITAQSNTSIEHNDATESEVDDPEPVTNLGERATRGRKRSLPTPRRTTPSKRGRRVSSSGGGDLPLLPPPEPANTARVEVEKPDANMCLKYTFGVNAWRQWVSVKNNELEKAASNNRKLKLFKPEILQLTSDELNYSLCLFVKEVRKPNGTEYAPDTIYYLVLGIQQYLFENGRIDNIFTDPYYEKFTECLDEVAKKFAVLYNDQQYIVTRVEEEHLWESKQLGAHSPHVLLSTLMFFNTKHFNLTTVEEHMQLSFSHIMKHWKRNPNQPGGVAKVPGSRNVLLRFYPPQSSLEANSKKKKVYEQQENEDNPLRCPVKLYEFYLSKCPESVKTRNDVFYLLPERSCVPDSPVWYSTMALGKDPLMKMLHRVKMVKEINIALLQP